MNSTKTDFSLFFAYIFLGLNDLELIDYSFPEVEFAMRTDKDVASVRYGFSSVRLTRFRDLMSW